MGDPVVQQARAIYNIRQWSAGYFDINAQGQVAALPRRGDVNNGISIPQLVNEVEARGLDDEELTTRFDHVARHAREAKPARSALLTAPSSPSA